MADTIKLSDLQPDPNNANRGTERGRYMLEQSLRKLGAGRSIVLDAKGRIIAGNKTAETAGEIGLEDVVVVRTRGDKLVAVLREDLDLDDPTGQARELAYADNRAGQVSLEFDPDVIGADLAAGLDLSDWWTPGELEDIGAIDNTPEEADAAPQHDRAEELREAWGVETGQLWRLPSRAEGQEHRLICGDCTDAAVGPCVSGVTSPPYSVGKDYETADVNEWHALISGLANNLQTDLIWINLANKRTGNGGYERDTWGDLVRIFEKAGFGMIGLRVWVKGAAWAGQNPYWLQTYKPVDDFEFVGLFSLGKPPHRRRLTDAEYRDWGWRGVWELPSVAANKLHSATFPVDLAARCIRLTSDPGDTIYEPFSGSGTTIIAAENLARQCRAVEISPAYVAVALQRYQDAFGITPELLDI